ncbi:GntR family transcriptional regulator [Micromonospora sp. NPDC049679]|uniref:GntR family transcriptional regulator n=1 Tax=Micromonospora sp. NPDC049679 TaxID=3155920 RepID=UPI0033D71CB4
MISDERNVTGYRQLADVLRDEIGSGALPAGSRFPSERDLQQRFGLARDTVRSAVAILRGEGLVVVRHGQPTRVSDHDEKDDLALEPGAQVEARMPTPAERQRLEMPQGWPVLHVVRRDGTGDLYPANRFRLITPDS